MFSNKVGLFKTKLNYDKEDCEVFWFIQKSQNSKKVIKLLETRSGSDAAFFKV